MPRVQQVEDAIGEDDAALRGAPGGGRLDRPDLRGCVQSGWLVLGWNEKLWLKNGSDTVSL